MHDFELLTNFDSPTTRALQIAAGRLGGRVTPLDDLEGPQDLAALEPAGALVFVYGWPAHALRQLEGLRAAGVPTAVWQVDDPSHFRNPEIHDVVVACAQACDVFFSHTLELADEYAARGVTVEYLPTAARDLPGLAALVGPPPAEEALELDYVFVASPSPARREAFARLERLLPGLRGQFVSGVTQIEAMRRSRHARVTLFFGANSTPDGPPEGWGLSERSWEVPLVGGLLVQEDRIHLRDHFEPGVDAVPFSTIAECADHVAALVGDPERRRELALRAREKVLASHRLCDRLRRVVERLAAVRTTGRVA